MNQHDSPKPIPAPASPPAMRKRVTPARWAAAHFAAALLAAVALFFLFWFFFMYGAWLSAFRGLFLSWQPMGGGFDFYGLGWGIVLVVLCGVVGWYYLEGLELYLPRLAVAALSLTFGLGLIGFALECLAIPYLLSRQTIAAAFALLLIVLAVRATRRHRARPEGDPASTEGDPRENFLRRRLAREAFRDSLVRPCNPLHYLFAAAALAVIAAITLADCWHALLYPELYWDSLILYLGYARMTFLQHGFPVKVVGQVGIGLGANYPHLYAVLGAGAATLAGEWSELPQRLIAPLAGMATTVLVYHSALRLSRHVNFALAVALLWRAVPMGVDYDQVASDYALTLLFSAAFLYLCLMYVETILRSYCAAAALLIALAMHINYLMGILWLPWAVTLFVAHFNWREPDIAAAAPWTRRDWRPSPLSVLFSFWLWRILIGSLLVASTWYLRNWLVTGNPVYAFFYKQLGGIHINPDVMAAAAKEWSGNGAGIGRLDDQPEIRSIYPLLTRLRGAWYFFVTYKLAYLFAPLFTAFAVPGFLAWLGQWLAAPFRRRTSQEPPHAQRVLLRFGLVLAVYNLALMAFHFTIAPFYLYQIVMILPGLALMAALAWPLWKLRPWRWLWGAMALWVGIFPGLTMALMGFKLGGAVPVGPGRLAPWESLFVLRHPMPKPQDFYAWRYHEDARMWTYINERLAGRKILTHENRHLVFDPRVELIHLDDWPMQALWNLNDPVERIRQLRMIHGVRYYLYVPNELNCPTNARMGAADWPKLGLAELEFQAGDNRLYRLVLPEDAAAVLP